MIEEATTLEGGQRGEERRRQNKTEQKQDRMALIRKWEEGQKRKLNRKDKEIFYFNIQAQQPYSRRVEI